MMTWYDFTPQDTIFFRGAQPMVKGESHSSTFNFPPPPQTIIGALRTTILRQKNINIKEDYYHHKVDKDILDILGRFDEPAGFNLIGPFFKVKGDVYIPAPYTWYFEKKEDNHNCGFTIQEREENQRVRILKSEKLNINFITGSKKDLYWVKQANNEVETLGGKWIKLYDFNDNANELCYLTNNDLYVSENRVGIALDKNYRSARKHHIYQFSHIRLKQGVSIIFGTDKDLPIDDGGVLTLGAERRFGSYKKIQNIELPNIDSGLYMSLSLIEGSQQTNDSVIATGKTVYLGGWDLKKGFHKPMRGYFPIGTVFNKKINKNCISI